MKIIRYTFRDQELIIFKINEISLVIITRLQNRIIIWIIE
jgi:hypothetical protein